MVCVLGLFCNLVCELGFFRGLKRRRKVRNGSERSVSADSGFEDSSFIVRERL
jgi:hypothetical protein